MSEQKFIDFNLTTPISYAYKGEMQEGGFITLNAPTSKNMKECAELKQAFFRALPKNQGAVQAEPTKDEEDAELTGDAIMGLISMSDNVELSVVLATARELFSSGLAMVEGETKVTKPILDSLTLDDLECMVGEYLAVFILASALKKMKKL